MFVSVDLPIPGEPPSSTSDPGTRPPPRTMSSSPMAVLSRGARSALTSRRGTGRAHGPADARRARRAAGSTLLDQRVPLAARRALAVPLRRLRAARGAGEHGGRLGHLRSLGRGPVASAPGRLVLRLRWLALRSALQHHRGKGGGRGSGRAPSSSGACALGVRSRVFRHTFWRGAGVERRSFPVWRGYDRRSTARPRTTCCETRAKCAGTPPGYRRCQRSRQAPCPPATLLPSTRQ